MNKLFGRIIKGLKMRSPRAIEGYPSSLYNLALLLKDKDYIVIFLCVYIFGELVGILSKTIDRGTVSY